MKNFLTGLIIGLLITTIPVAFASMLPPKTVSFSDVNDTDWYFPYVNYLFQIDMISGYTDGTFKPENAVNRAEMTKIIYQTFEEFQKLDVRSRVSSLEDQVEALQAIVGTLDLPGTCYYNNKWYQDGESDLSSGRTCKSNGVMPPPVHS